MKLDPHRRVSRLGYTEASLLESAQKYKTLAEWKEGNKCACRAAANRGTAFFAKCRAHMVRQLPRNRPPMPLKARWRTMPKEEVIASAKKYNSRTEWRYSPDWYYHRAAKRHGDEFYAECCSHMTAGATPWNTLYVIYAFEFEDRSAYVGLTFQPEVRKLGHFQRGPVAEHLNKCAKHTWKVIQGGIDGVINAGMAERSWIAKYAMDGWHMLNRTSGGETGIPTTKFSDEDLVDDASNYPTRKAWHDSHGYAVHLAKKRGIYAQCCAHMALRPTKPVTAETRAKMREAAKRRATPEWRAKHSAFMTKWIVANGSPAKRPGVAAKISAAKLGVKLTPEHCAAISAAKLAK